MCIRDSVGGEPAVASRVDAGSVPGWYGEQFGVVGGWQGADEVQADVGEVGEVRGRVLPGVEDHRQVLVVGGQCPVAGDELVDDGGEHRHVGPVAGVGIPCLLYTS